MITNYLISCTLEVKRTLKVLFILCSFNCFAQITEIELEFEEGIKQDIGIFFQQNIEEFGHQVYRKDVEKKFNLKINKIGVLKIFINQKGLYLFIENGKKIILTKNKEGRISISGSVPSSQMFDLDSLWVVKVKELTLKNSFKDRKEIVKAFEEIKEKILIFSHPECVDWGLGFLFNIENSDNLDIIPIQYFLNLKNELISRYPDYSFREFNKLIQLRIKAEKK